MQKPALRAGQRVLTVASPKDPVAFAGIVFDASRGPRSARDRASTTRQTRVQARRRALRAGAGGRIGTRFHYTDSRARVTDKLKLASVRVPSQSNPDRSTLMGRAYCNQKQHRARKAGKTLGRPEGAIEKGLEAKRAKAKSLLGEGAGIVRAAKMVGLGVGTVHQIKRDMTA
jgi:hypothetical protein